MSPGGEHSVTIQADFAEGDATKQKSAKKRVWSSLQEGQAFSE